MISIRKAVMEDAALIQCWENDSELWKITDEPGPFELADIVFFLKNQNDLFNVQQERWLIVSQNSPIGMLDIFQWDMKMRSIGVGIVIMQKEQRGKGIGGEVMKQLEAVLVSQYSMHSMWAVVGVDNDVAIRFFMHLGYYLQKEFMHQGKKAFRFEKKIQ